jgi:hypothetical protein
LFSCHFGKPIEHLGFVSILDSGSSFLILGTLTFFCSDLAPRILMDDSCWYFLTSTEVNPQAYGITVVAFTRKYSGYRISTGNGGTSSS